MFRYVFFITVLTIAIILVGCGGDDTVDVPPGFACTDGVAADRYPCRNIDLLAHLPPDSLLGDTLNDIWGWTDPETGKQYALVGLTDGVTFVDISVPHNPAVVGKLTESVMAKSEASDPGGSGAYLQHDEEAKAQPWRDFKVYRDHLFVVSDGQRHGMQVFDLRRLRNAASSPSDYTEDILYTGIEYAHNIAVNEETGYAYIVGSNEVGGGLFIVDVSDPLAPQFAGFHADSAVGRESTGYVHDTQCVIYRGPDSDHQGQEVCFNSSETHLVLANVTRKDSTFTIARKRYEGNAYAHQGWLTEDHQYFLMGDEVDELRASHNTRTYIWDVRDLDDPRLIGMYESSKGSIDHNQYIKGDYTYQANYTSGLRIVSLTGIASGELREVAYFDTFTGSDRPVFRGAWSNYPFFASGVVIVSDISEGLFVLRPSI